MPHLNAEVEFPLLDPGVRRAFVGGVAEKRLIPANLVLYKFTSSEWQDAEGRITPWWSSVEPLDSADPGYSGSNEAAFRLQTRPKDYGRARSAVSLDWNDMGTLTFARTNCPVWAFVGRCAGQRTNNKDPERSNVYFIGGAWQLFVPNLKPNHVTRLSLSRPAP